MDRSKRQCLLVGTCITFGIEYLLRLSDDFQRHYTLETFATHYQDQILENLGMSAADLANADVVIFHPPGWADWGNEAGYENLLASIPPHSQTITIPYPVFHAFWPFHCYDERNKNPDDRPAPRGETVAYSYGDSYLLGLLRQGLSPEAATRQYLSVDVAGLTDLDRLLTRSFERQEPKEAETSVKILDFVAENLKRKRTFLTINHIANTTLLHMTNQILAQLALPALSDRVLDDLAELLQPEMPIHPSVCRHFGLDFANAETRYAYYAHRRPTFAEYILDYAYFR